MNKRLKVGIVFFCFALVTMAIVEFTVVAKDNWVTRYKEETKYRTEQRVEWSSIPMPKVVLNPYFVVQVIEPSKSINYSVAVEKGYWIILNLVRSFSGVKPKTVRLLINSTDTINMSVDFSPCKIFEVNSIKFNQRIDVKNGSGTIQIWIFNDNQLDSAIISGDICVRHMEVEIVDWERKYTVEVPYTEQVPYTVNEAYHVKLFPPEFHILTLSFAITGVVCIMFGILKERKLLKDGEIGKK